MMNVEKKLRKVTPGIVEGTPVLFAYLYGSYAKKLNHVFSDLDIAVYVDGLDTKDRLDLELSLALRFDEAMEHAVQSEVRSINCLPLSVKGRILSEAILIYTKDEEKRVVFEKQVRTAYFDFLPVIRNYRQIYRQKLKTDSHHGIH